MNLHPLYTLFYSVTLQFHKTVFNLTPINLRTFFMMIYDMFVHHKLNYEFFLQGMRAALTLLVLTAVCSTACSALCPQGDKFWNPHLERCINCTRCNSSENQFVLRPCEVHRDTVCGPFHQLDIDWNWVNKHHRPRHHGKHGHGRHRESENGEGKQTSIEEVRLKCALSLRTVICQ